MPPRLPLTYLPICSSSPLIALVCSRQEEAVSMTMRFQKLNLPIRTIVTEILKRLSSAHTSVSSQTSSTTSNKKLFSKISGNQVNCNSRRCWIELIHQVPNGRRWCMKNKLALIMFLCNYQRPTRTLDSTHTTNLHFSRWAKLKSSFKIMQIIQFYKQNVRLSQKNSCWAQQDIRKSSVTIKTLKEWTKRNSIIK